MLTSATLKSVQDIMRKDTGVDGDAQRISQLVWMLFLKIFDDKEKEYELRDKNYTSPISEKLRWRNWALDDEGITGDALLNFVNNELFPKLKELSVKEGDDPKGFIVKEVFEDAYNYMKSGTLMRQVINKLNQDFDFNNIQDRHVFNDIYEKLLNDLQSAGNAGEYYTPRAVTEFVTEMVHPRLGEKVLDPAMGTGGFLTSAINLIRKNDIKTPDDEQVLQDCFYGFDKKPLPHLLCITNLILHGIEAPANIRRDNALSRPLRDYTEKDRVEVVLMNPPFGGTEEDGIEKNFPSNFQTRETSLLFLVLIIHLLKQGGRAGIVLPDGVLFGEGVATKVKQKLLEECNLHTIVRLPNGVFAPYTGIRTNLLFFEKGNPTKEVWYFDHPYPTGVKTYNKTRSINIKEFDLERDWWNKRVENEHTWKVSISQIRERNYNLDFKNPSKTVTKENYSSKDLISKIAISLNESTKLLNEIRSELK